MKKNGIKREDNWIHKFQIPFSNNDNRNIRMTKFHTRERIIILIFFI